MRRGDDKVDDKSKIKIKIKQDDVEISVFMDDSNEFESGYRTIRKLNKQRLTIDGDIDIEEKLEILKPDIVEAQKKINYLWSESDDWNLVGDVDDAFDAAVLVLLRIWPECMSETEIGRKISKAPSTVGDWLRGEVRNLGIYFSKCKEGGYTLTLDGITYVIEEVIPKILGETMIEPDN